MATHTLFISRQAGFTLVEAMITLAILATLSALTLVNLGRPQTSASMGSTVDTLMADLSGERALAMSGDTGSGATQQPHGVRIQPGEYTLFAGSSFTSGDSANYTTEAGNGIQMSTTFPDGQVLFDIGSGEVHDFDAAHNTITVTGADMAKTLTINRFGVVTVE